MADRILQPWSLSPQKSIFSWFWSCEVDGQGLEGCLSPEVSPQFKGGPFLPPHPESACPNALIRTGSDSLDMVTSVWAQIGKEFPNHHLPKSRLQMLMCSAVDGWIDKMQHCTVGCGNADPIHASTWMKHEDTITSGNGLL